MERPVLVIPAEHIPELETYADGIPKQVSVFVTRMPYNSFPTRAKKHYAKAMYELALATYWTAKDTEAKAKAKAIRKAQKTDA